jgi:hypothetical protein
MACPRIDVNAKRRYLQLAPASRLTGKAAGVMRKRVRKTAKGALRSKADFVFCQAGIESRRREAAFPPHRPRVKLTAVAGDGSDSADAARQRSVQESLRGERPGGDHQEAGGNRYAGGAQEKAKREQSGTICGEPGQEQIDQGAHAHPKIVR